MTTEQSLPILDDTSRLQLVDKRNMLRIIDELPEQCETAMNIGRSFVGPDFDIAPDAVHLIGSGDCSSACDIARLILAEYVGVPITIGHLGPLPRFVGASTLAVLVDYVGDSPDALKTYGELSSRGVKTVCITSGRKLSEMALAGGARIFKVPSGQAVRSAFGYLVISIIATLSACGLATGVLERLSAATLLLKNAREEFRFSRPTDKNAAKQCAESLFNKNVYVLGAGSPMAAVAGRWKSQINQNSKSAACSANLLDAVTGTISGLEKSADSDQWAVVILRSEHESPEASAVSEAVLEVLKSYTPLQVRIKGKTTAESIFYGVYFADYVSCYLALLYDVNPTVTGYADMVQQIIANASETV